MNCKNCGTPIVPGEMFCKNCGANLNVDNAANNNSMATPVAAQSVVQTQQPVTPTPVMPQPAPMMQPNNQFQQLMPVVQPNKSNKGIIVLVVVIIVAVLAICGVLLITKGKNNGNHNSNSNSSSNSNPTSNTPVEPVSTQTSKVRFEGFEFNIPTDYLFEIQTSALYVSDNMTWASTLEVIDGAYSTIKVRKDQIKLNMEKAGYQASTPVVKNYGGAEWITIEVANGASKAIVAYTQGSATKIIGVSAYTKSNTFDYTILDKMGRIVKNSTYVGYSQSLAQNNKVKDITASKGLGK